MSGKDNNLRFVTHAVDCEWGPWSEWGPCSVSCGKGDHLRSRVVNVRPMNGGKDCGLKSDESERCNVGDCVFEAPKSLSLTATTTEFNIRADNLRLEPYTHDARLVDKNA